MCDRIQTFFKLTVRIRESIHLRIFKDYMNKLYGTCNKCINSAHAQETPRLPKHHSALLSITQITQYSGHQPRLQYTELSDFRKLTFLGLLFYHIAPFYPIACPSIF